MSRQDAVALVRISIWSHAINANENTRPATLRRGTGRNALPLTLRRPVNPAPLNQLMSKAGNSLSRAGLCGRLLAAP